MDSQTATSARHPRSPVAVRIACTGADVLPYDQLLAYQGSLKALSDENYGKLRRQILEHGFSSPVHIWRHAGLNYILDGHQRLATIQRLVGEGIEVPPLPVVYVEASGHREAKLKVLSLTSQFGEMTTDSLRDFAIEAELDLAEIVESFRFPEVDLDALLEPEADVAAPGSDPDDAPEAPTEPKSKLGDVWTLGAHRLLCGDSTNVQHVERLLDGEKPDMVYTDPPYGIGYAGKGITSAGVKGNDFGAIRGDDTIDAAVDAYHLCKAMAVRVQVWWGANFYCSALDDRCSWIIWDKQIVGEIYSACELAWTNQRGRLRMIVHKWHGMVKGSEHGQARVHPTQKPIALAEWCFNEFERIATVLDLFLGSGSTLIACENSGRRCFGMELDPKYVDVILARWAKYTGKDPVRDDGVTWSELQDEVAL